VSKRQRLYLHIGAPKTGTTYIQDLLWINKDRLRAGGLYVPGQRQLDHFHFERDLRDNVQPPNHPEERWEGRVGRMAAEMLAEGAPTNVISAERLCAATRPQVESALDQLADFDVHVVYGVRDLASLLTSEWQESVKHGNRRQLHQWLDELESHNDHEWFWQANDYARVFGNWDLGDPSRTHVVTFPRPGSPSEEVWLRFAAAIGWSGRVEFSAGRPNESLGFLEASVVARIQERIPPGFQLVRRVHIMRAEVAGNKLAQREDRMPILIPERHREWITRDTARRLDQLEQSGYDTIGDLADLRDLDRRFGDVSTDGHEAEMLDAAVDAAAELVTLLARERIRNDRLRRKIREAEDTPGRRISEMPRNAARRLPERWRAAVRRW